MDSEPPRELKVGLTYFIPKLSREVTLLEVLAKGHKARVKGGAMTMVVPRTDLRLLGAQQKKKGEKFHFQMSKNERQNRDQLTVDCRGMRLEEFQNKVEEALGNLLSGELPFAEIVHGHGDGILKRWLREHLRTRKEFSYEIPPENDGTTVIKVSPSP